MCPPFSEGGWGAFSFLKLNYENFYYKISADPAFADRLGPPRLWSQRPPRPPRRRNIGAKWIEPCSRSIIIGHDSQSIAICPPAASVTLDSA